MNLLVHDASFLQRRLQLHCNRLTNGRFYITMIYYVFSIAGILTLLLDSVFVQMLTTMLKFITNNVTDVFVVPEAQADLLVQPPAVQEHNHLHRVQTQTYQ